MTRIATLSLLLASVGCVNVGNNEDEGRVWNLVWEEQFNGADGNAPAAGTWTVEEGRGPDGDGWGNNELQYYTTRTDNIGLTGDGSLRITAQAETPSAEFDDAEWTSARLVTKDKFSFQYGRVEASIKTPVARAVWPAFWMLGADIDENPWPLAGEIDIMEVFGERAVGSAIHGPGYSGGNNIGYTYLTDDDLEGYDEPFHIYEIIWDPEQIVFLVDDNVVGVSTPADLPTGAAWVFDHEFYFLLNMAIGGNPVQAPDDTTPESSDMLVDYIRVFERVEPLLDPNAPVALPQDGATDTE